MEWLLRYIREGLPEDLAFELRPQYWEGLLKIWVQRFLGRETTRAKASGEASLSMQKNGQEAWVAEVEWREVGRIW